MNKIKLVDNNVLSNLKKKIIVIIFKHDIDIK